MNLPHTSAHLPRVHLARMCFVVLFGISIIGMVSGSLTPAMAFGDDVEGKEVAKRWCAACHLVSTDQTNASSDVPPFAEIKKKYGGKMEFLEAFLTESHPRMPDMNLSYFEIQNLIAYIESL